MAEKNQVPVATLEYEPTSFEQALIKHKTKLILVGVLAIAGTVGYWGWRLVKESQHHSAALDFTRASTVAELKDAASKHAGQTAGGNALILAAEKLFAENKGTEAIATLKDFQSKNAEHPLRDLATWRLAEYQAASGDTAAAEKEYEAAGQSADSPFSGLALLRLGDLKWAAGDKEKAKEYYEKILLNPAMTGNPARLEAQERVDKTLKVNPPTLVEYVAPLLPPPKLGGGNNSMGGGHQGLPEGLTLPEGMTMPEGFTLPEGFPAGDEPPFAPPVPGGKPFNVPGLLDETPAPPPAPPAPPFPPAGENKDNKNPAESGKPATGSQP